MLYYAKAFALITKCGENIETNLSIGLSGPGGKRDSP